MFHYQEESVPAFGVLLTPANIKSYLQKIRADWEGWAKNHPDMVQFVEELKAR